MYQYNYIYIIIFIDRGSDGFVFPKNIQKDDTVKVFNRNFCRSLSFKYQKEMADKNGIDGYR